MPMRHRACASSLPQAGSPRTFALLEISRRRGPDGRHIAERAYELYDAPTPNAPSLLRQAADAVVTKEDVSAERRKSPRVGEDHKSILIRVLAFHRVVLRLSLRCVEFGSRVCPVRG